MASPSSSDQRRLAWVTHRRPSATLCLDQKGCKQSLSLIVLEVAAPIFHSRRAKVSVTKYRSYDNFSPSASRLGRQMGARMRQTALDLTSSVETDVCC